MRVSESAVCCCGCAEWSPAMSTSGSVVGLRVRAGLVVWEESQQCVVFVPEAQRSIVCMWWSARVGGRPV